MTSTEWQIWQLVDSAFPTGGFAHSGGLEAAWSHYAVRNSGQLTGFLNSALWQMGHASLPFLAAAHHESANTIEIDEFYHATLSNAVANRASRLQGAAWLATASRVFSLNAPKLSHGHLAPAFGTILRLLEIDRDATLRLFTFHHLRSLISAAVRLNIVGPLEGQRVQHHFNSLSEEVVLHCGQLKLDDITQTSPLIELLHGTHDRLYSRLFQS